MIISKYTTVFSKNDKFYIYNSLSNFFGEIDEDFYNYLQGKKKKEEDINIEELENDLWNVLCEQKIFTENNDDDFLLYTSVIKRQRQISNSLILTIAPTMDCNFSCPYCFETKEKGVMASSTVQNIVNWISKYKNIEHLHITWFGGEPLLAPHVIDNITNNIRKSITMPFSSNIITNGYYLTEKNLKLLSDCGVKSIQVSIDGLYDSHNIKRYSSTDKKTFDTILKNIDNFHQLDLDMMLTIRVGIDKSNYMEYSDVHDFFTKRYSNSKNISILPALIIETTKQNCNESCLTDPIDRFELYKKFSILTESKRYIYPLNIVSECAVRNPNSWAIDAKGDVYKCWEIIGNRDYKVGELDEEGVKITNKKILNRYLFGADPFEEENCRNCFSLPICGGGCPHKRIENKFNKQNFKNCTCFNENIEDYLSLRAELALQ